MRLCLCFCHFVDIFIAAFLFWTVFKWKVWSGSFSGSDYEPSGGAESSSFLLCFFFFFFLSRVIKLICVFNLELVCVKNSPDGEFFELAQVEHNLVAEFVDVTKLSWVGVEQKLPHWAVVKLTLLCFLQPCTHMLREGSEVTSPGLLMCKKTKTQLFFLFFFTLTGFRSHSDFGKYCLD